MVPIHIRNGDMTLRKGGNSTQRKEAEYPRALCEQYAIILERIVFETNERQQCDVDQGKVRPNQQVKGRGVPQIVPEFAAVRTLLASETPPLTDKKLLTRAWLGVPAGAKLLRTEAKRGEVKMFCFWNFSQHAAVCQRVQAVVASF